MLTLDDLGTANLLKTIDNNLIVTLSDYCAGKVGCRFALVAVIDYYLGVRIDVVFGYVLRKEEGLGGTLQDVFA